MSELTLTDAFIEYKNNLPENAKKDATNAARVDTVSAVNLFSH